MPYWWLSCNKLFSLSSPFSPCIAEYCAACGPVCSAIINDLGAGAVQEGGNSSLSPGRATGAISGSFDFTSIPLSPGRGIYLPTQSHASYSSASSSPSACRPSTCFEIDNNEADARENVIVADGHANVRASAVMTDDNSDDGVDNGDFDDTWDDVNVAQLVSARDCKSRGR